MENIDLTLHVGNDVIGSAFSVRDLGVILDCELAMKKHKTPASLVQAFVISLLDYCNSILAWLQKLSIMLLQQIHNAAARLILALGPRDHVTLTLHDLHWLPLEQRIIFKLCSLMHLVNTGHSPQCLRELVSLTSDITSRSRLRSESSRRYETPATRLKIGEWCFLCWFGSMSSLHDIRDHQALQRNLKTELFNHVHTT